MANITSIYPIRYTQDKINQSAYGLITCKDLNYLDLTQADHVTAITFSTIPDPLPSSTVNCRLAFNTGNGWFRVDSNGTAEELETQNISVESVLEEGNTIAELSALNDIPAFANSQLRYAIALESKDPDNVKPKVKFTLTCLTDTQQLTQTVISPEYTYSDLIVVTNISVDSSVTAGGSLTVQGRYRDSESDEYSDWVNMNAIVGVITNALQFRAIMTVSEVNIGQSVLNSIKVSYNEGGIVASSGGASEIITVTRDWRVDLRHCRVVVRHAKLDGSSIECYVAFRKKSIKVTGEVLGTGTGLRQTLTLQHADGVKLDTVRVYESGCALSNTFDVNCQTGRIVLEASAGSTITCDYEYGWELEDWTQLNLDYTEEYDGYDQSVYRVTMPENLSGEIKSIAVIKLKLLTTSGTNSEGYISSDGSPAVYKLRYPVKDGNIRVYDGETLLTGNSIILSVDKQDTRYITLLGYSSESLRVSYDWESASPVVYEVSGIFSK